ncbi:MAG: glutamine-hydrolyzing carbamoyl-phosphate synthase small subunit [bacterium]|nr:glutamine-hydrolyzing carbamoyl-phosphate synthase small subunit [bacterium]
MKKGVIYLEDGTYLFGRSFGADGIKVGEIIFNTGMTGYQEILTDPSYKEQIVVMTYPHIGNYGVNLEDDESVKVWLEGFVIKELEEIPSNWRSKMTLSEFLEKNGVVGLEGVDTRFLTRKIREKGTMKAVLLSDEKQADLQTLKKILAEYPGLEGRDIVKYVTCREPYLWSEGLWKHSSIIYESRRIKPDKKIIVYDFGVKRNILRNLAEIFGEVQVVPAYTPAEDVLGKNPDGVVLSNGPGDPAPLLSIQNNVKKMIGKVPVLAICLGHQILGLSLGAKTYKLKFGHHGINHPVKNIHRASIEITSQNHGFAVDPNTFPEDIKQYIVLTHKSLNDGTFEGFKSDKLNFICVQYHPEAGPGPSDSSYIFDEFAKMIMERKI